MTEEKREKQYLSHLLAKIDHRIFEINQAIQLKKEEIDYMNHHKEEHKKDVDHLEKKPLQTGKCCMLPARVPCINSALHTQVN